MRGNQALHWLAVLFGTQPAATQLSAPETNRLLELARNASVVAEIGVFEGVTSRRMMEVMPIGGTIYCVDPFFAGRLGLAYGLFITRTQIRRARRTDVTCHIVRKLSHDFAQESRRDFDLVFIDADHSYAAVRRDWADWSTRVRIGGHIALHDSIPIAGRCPSSCGPVQLVGELGEEPPGFKRCASADTLSVYCRVA